MASVWSASSLNRLIIFVGGVRLAVRLADDSNRLVEGVEDDPEALEDVDALAQLGQLELEAAGDHLEPEVEELARGWP